MCLSLTLLIKSLILMCYYIIHLVHNWGGEPGSPDNFSNLAHSMYCIGGQ